MRITETMALDLSQEDWDKLSKIEKQALRSIAAKLEKQAVTFQDDFTFGQRLADKVAAVGGSWAFIIGFGCFLATWAGANTELPHKFAFDPYPFIFLNLLLSMLAALQAPVIMMSQNRQAIKDRLTAQMDLEVDMKAAATTEEIHSKVDRILEHLGLPHDLPGV